MACREAGIWHLLPAGSATDHNIYIFTCLHQQQDTFFSHHHPPSRQVFQPLPIQPVFSILEPSTRQLATMRGLLSTALAIGVTLLPVVTGAAIKARDEVPEPIEGYRGPISIGNATINAPLDENGKETYLGMFASYRLELGVLTPWDQSRIQVLPRDSYSRSVRGCLHKHQQLQPQASGCRWNLVGMRKIRRIYPHTI